MSLAAAQASTLPKPPVVAGGEISRLATHASHYLAGLVGSLAIGLISFPVFTRVFSVAEYGLIDLAQKVLLLLWAASKLGLQNAALRFYDGPRFESDPSARQSYFSTLFLGVLASASAVALVFVVVEAAAPVSYMNGPLARLLSYVVVLLLLRSLGSMLWTFLRVEERTKAYNALTVGSKAATLGLVCALLPAMGRSAQTYFTGLILVEAALVAGLVSSLLRRRLLAPSRFEISLLRMGIAYGAPLVVYEFSFNVLGSTDRFLVRSFLGGEALGFYSVAYGLAQHVNEFLLLPLSLALTPIYMRIWTAEGADKTAQFLSFSFDVFLMAAAGILAVAAACAHEVVMVLASAKYAGADRLIPLLLAGLLVYTTHLFLAAGLLIYKRTVLMAGVLMGSAALNVCLNWWLLPRMGLLGAALSALLSYSLGIVWLGYLSRRLLPLRVDGRAMARYLAAAGAAWLAASGVGLGPHAVNLVAKSVTALAVYAAALYAMDPRVRAYTCLAVGRRLAIGRR